MDPHCKDALASKEALEYWSPVDWYNGGMEHTTLHLLYSRFWHKFLYDIGVVHTKEPYAKRTSHGMILGQNPHYVGNVSTQEEKDALIAKYGNQALRPAVKMSKSLGNFFTVRDVAEKYGYEPIRYLLISAQYRSPINYSTDIIEQCIAALNRLYTCRDSLDFELKNAADAEHDGDKAIIDGFDKYREQFIAAMDDDLNTADAIASIFELVRDINTNVVGKTPSKALVEGAIAMFDELTGVLGLVYNRKTETLDSDVEALIEARTNARKEKNWAEADRIRDQLKEMGIVLEDTAQGVKWHRE